jgi:nicotinamide-nucleotide amidase
MNPYEQSVEFIASALQLRKEKVAVAESVTAGEIQAALSYGQHALQYFEGGVVVYTIKQKVHLLQVNAEHALTCNCVSEQISSEMARSVAVLFNTDWGIAITGYASTVPELNINTLFAYVALSYKGNIIHSRQIFAPDLSVLDNRK